MATTLLWQREYLTSCDIIEQRWTDGTRLLDEEFRPDIALIFTL